MAYIVMVHIAAPLCRFGLCCFTSVVVAPLFPKCHPYVCVRAGNLDEIGAMGVAQRLGRQAAWEREDAARHQQLQQEQHNLKVSQARKRIGGCTGWGMRCLALMPFPRARLSLPIAYIQDPSKLEPRLLHQ